MFETFIPNLFGYKYGPARHFGSWYYALKASSPNHFITFGSTPTDIYNWDAMTFPVDYVNLHYYPERTKVYSDTTIEKNNSDLKWFSEIMDIPWIVGETSIAGNDYAHTIRPEIVTEEQQLKYAEEALALSRWYGAIGFTWWCYKEFHWFSNDTTIGLVWENYFGLVKRGTYEEPKVVDTAFQSFNPSYVCDTCSLPNTSIYYYPYKLPQLVASGKVVDENNVGIKNALVRIDVADPINYGITGIYTYSDENGDYKIYKKPEDFSDGIYVTYPGKQFSKGGVWTGPTQTQEEDFTLLSIPPTLSPNPSLQLTPLLLLLVIL